MPTGPSGRGRHAAPKRSRSAAPLRSKNGADVARGRSGSRPAPSRAKRASRENEILLRKKKNSSKAASKGAILILAIALIAIKAFSSLPSTVKTSSDKRVHSASTQSGSGSLGASLSPSKSQRPYSSSSTTTSHQVVPPSVAPSTAIAPRVTTTTLAPPPSKSAATASGNSLVTVRVFNGTTVAGAAAKTTNLLAQAGYDVVAPTDASTHSMTVTQIYYSPGYRTQATQLCAALGISTASEQPVSFSSPLSSVRPSDLNVVLGTDKAS